LHDLWWFFANRFSAWHQSTQFAAKTVESEAILCFLEKLAATKTYFSVSTPLKKVLNHNLQKKICFIGLFSKVG